MGNSHVMFREQPFIVTSPSSGFYSLLASSSLVFPEPFEEKNARFLCSLVLGDSSPKSIVNSKISDYLVLLGLGSVPTKRLREQNLGLQLVVLV